MLYAYVRRFDETNIVKKNWKLNNRTLHAVVFFKKKIRRALVAAGAAEEELQQEVGGGHQEHGGQVAPGTVDDSNKQWTWESR